MTCAHCIGGENIFNEKEARKNLKHYNKKGPNKTTIQLLNALEQQDMTGLSLLDIGGGIGVIQIELLKKGVSQATDVDASQAYITAARQLAKQEDLDKKTRHIYADFIDCHKDIGGHDIVTLEKVVCCYPQVEDLIRHSTAKAGKYYGLVYPLDGAVAKAVNKMAHLYFKMTKNPFRTQIHSEKMMDKLIRQNGFQRIYYSMAFPWKIALYKRVEPIL